MRARNDAVEQFEELRIFEVCVLCVHVICQFLVLFFFFVELNLIFW